MAKGWYHECDNCGKVDLDPCADRIPKDWITVTMKTVDYEEGITYHPNPEDAAILCSIDCAFEYMSKKKQEVDEFEANQLKKYEY